MIKILKIKNKIMFLEKYQYGLIINIPALFFQYY